MEIYCDECGAQFRNSCHCQPQPPISDKQERWTGMDGHAYIGDPQRSSAAMHDDERCLCGTPDWY